MSTVKLRQYQLDLRSAIYSSWQEGAVNVMAVMPTGAGKTATFSNIMAEYKGASIAIVHRQEIVTQISLALARNEVRHKVIAPRSVVSACTHLHLAETGRNYVDPSNRVAIAGVQTLIRMTPDNWCRQVGLVVQDEAHHNLKSNSWGRANAMFPNALTLGVTATPVRADGAGLGRHADGLVDKMVLGPSMRDLIDAGWLTDYKIYAPPSDLQLAEVPVGSGGDYNPPKLAAAVKKSHILGDVVQHYIKLAAGKLGVTFAVDVAAAADISAAFRAAGVPSEIITGNTPDGLRASILRRFRNREILQLVNCDILGEGFDMPAIEVVSFARPTASYGLYCQQFGRSLRPMNGKSHAIVIDHVGNVHRHGLPDAPRVWTLDRRDKRAKGAAATVLVRVCPKCTGVYDRVRNICPFCGFLIVPANRGSIEEVEGDLAELDAETLAKMRGEIDRPVRVPYGASSIVVNSIHKVHREKAEVQIELRAVMAQWGGARVAEGDTLSMAQRRFYIKFGVDVATAQTLNARDATDLIGRITGDN